MLWVQPFSLKPFFWLLLMLVFPAMAKNKSCRGSLSASKTKTIKRYPRITRDVEKALLKNVTDLSDNNLGYFLSALFDAVARDNGYLQLDYEGLPFKALARMPYDVQIEFFTRAKSHPLLHESPPADLALVSKGGTPQYIARENRETLLKILEPYDLPDIEMDYLKLSPVVASDFDGASLEVYFSSNVKELLFQIDIADDGSAVVHSDGQILAAGPWKFENGFLKIDDKNNVQIDLRRASSESLKDIHTDVARIHHWGAFGLVQVRHLQGEMDEANGDAEINPEN